MKYVIHVLMVALDIEWFEVLYTHIGEYGIAAEQKKFLTSKRFKVPFAYS